MVFLAFHIGQLVVKWSGEVSKVTGIFGVFARLVRCAVLFLIFHSDLILSCR